jgi:membrane protein YqaA with SNARE-associated domain
MRLIARALEFGHNLGIRRWVGRLFPYADRWWFPPLAAALSAAATLSLSIPTGPVVMALVALNPRRWRAVVLWSVLGSAAAGALFTHLLGHFGSAWINERLPQLAASKHWLHLVGWVSTYGFVTLAAVAASPFAQTPALVLAALLGLPWPEVFGALLLGKGLKYSLVGVVTARTTSEPLATSAPNPLASATPTDLHRRNRHA